MSYICSMIHLKEDTSYNFGRALLMVLFFFLITSFAGKSVSHDRECYQSKWKTAQDLSAANTNVSDAIQLFVIGKSPITTIDSKNYNYFSEDLKVFADNKKTAQKIICLQQKHYRIKPILDRRFYNQLFPTGDDEVPILS